MGFEPVTSVNTGAMLHQLSYEATHWEQGQLIEFISPMRNDDLTPSVWLHSSISRA